MPWLALELLRDIIHQAFVEIVAAQMSIARSGADFEHTFTDVQDRDVERAAAQIEDHDGFVFLLVQTVGERGRCRLVDDPEHVQPGDLARILGRLALRIVEVSRDGDDGIGDLLAQVFRGVVGQLAEYLRGNLFRRVLLTLIMKRTASLRTGHYLIRNVLDFRLHFGITAPDEPFDRVNRVFRDSTQLAAWQAGRPTAPLSS